MAIGDWEAYVGDLSDIQEEADRLRAREKPQAVNYQVPVQLTFTHGGITYEVTAQEATATHEHEVQGAPLTRMELELGGVASFAPVSVEAQSLMRDEEVVHEFEVGYLAVLGGVDQLVVMNVWATDHGEAIYAAEAEGAERIEYVRKVDE
ncbi:hypothetical protein Q7C18_02620 [Nesterenkonia sp. CL21]|uniref:hypothetical protein n=1 Tax=Nesterenkonia sp. CL21 TaxID=3064894 RepID=UPI00287A9761|nr:hypothetical protein [Nesterenkonia sp. CL21]MDS2171582.1 hypothetical protein [Nesterenkonia sp. CL21]